MALNIGLIAIEGDHANALDDLFKNTSYRITGAEPVNTKVAAERLNELQADPDIVVKAACFADGWTMVVDPEIALAIDDEVLAAYARKSRRQVCSCACAGAAGAYSFALYSPKGDILRAIDVVNRVVQRNDGAPVKCEPINPTRLDETSTIAMFGAHAIPYDYFEIDRQYIVYELMYLRPSQAPPTPLPKDLAVLKPAKAVKPWWELW